MGLSNNGVSQAISVGSMHFMSEKEKKILTVRLAGFDFIISISQEQSGVGEGRWVQTP